MNRRTLRRHLVSINVTAFAALAMFACSSSSNSGSGSGSGDTSTVSGFIDSYCSYIGSCCGTQGRPSDGEQCRELLDFSNLTNYNAQKGQACIDAIKTASASDPAWCVASSSPANTACNQATTSGSGSAAPGANCTSDGDCAAGPTGSTVVCNYPISSTGTNPQEICMVELHGKAGDGPCFATVNAGTSSGTITSYNNNVDAGAGTAPEIYCFIADGVSCDSTSSLCVALGQIGATCDDDTQCVSGSHCTTGKCAANLATGAACVGETDCISGDYCDAASNTCAVQAAEGAACTTSNQCTSNDCENSKCGAGFGAALGLAFLCGGDGGS